MFNRPLGLIITNVMNAGQWGHLEERAGAGRGGGRRGGDAVRGRGRGAAPICRRERGRARTIERAEHEQGHAGRRPLLGSAAQLQLRRSRRGASSSP